MRMITRINRRTGWLVVLIIGCFFLFSAPLIAGTDTSEMSVIEPLVTQGSVKRFSTENNTISVKISKEEKIQILVMPLTEFIGMSSLEDLKKGKRIKVWYNIADKKNKAVKVELLLDTGC